VLPCAREGTAPFKGFIIAGKDKRWYPGTARHTRLDGKPCIEVRSDLVAEPVAVRYGWANWPTGNMVGRNRLPMPTFRTDDWPIPEGVNYSKEASAKSKAAIDQLKQAAAKQVLDRKIRQAALDVPRYETELYKGDVKGQVASKIARVEAILNELTGKEWAANSLRRENAELAEKIKALQTTVEGLKKELEGLKSK
jgi:hypothetical protein